MRTAALSRCGHPLVTIVMGAFNEEHVIRQAVLSIREQTYTHWELIVVDDSSSDGTPALLRELAGVDERIKVMRQARNRGLAASLNLGWSHGRGQLIARMDADDRSLPKRIERQVAFMQEHPEIAVLGTGAELLDDAGRGLGRVRRPERHEELVRKMYKETPFMHPSVMMRRELLEALGGYDDRLRGCEDIDLWLRAYQRYRFHNLQEPLIQYRVPNRASRAMVLWGTFVLARAAHREGLLLRRGWYAPRHFAATSLARLGLRRLRIG